MACSCNKPKTAATIQERRQSTSQPAANAPVPVQQTQQVRTAPTMRGVQQSFAMQAGGKTASFGSRLERDAAVARTGGRVV